MSNELVLKGKTAVITGGSEGIGYAIAENFASQGADLLLVARDNNKLEQAQKYLCGFDVKIKIFSADLSQEQTVDRLINSISSLNIPIDILVNNAGMAEFVAFEKTSPAQLSQHIALNVYAPYRLTQGLLDSLCERKGNVINISSYFAQRMLVGRPSSAYSLTKGAINSLTLSLAFELGSLGVRVNAIAPGTVETPLVKKNLEKLTAKNRKAFMASVSSIYPLGRLGIPNDIGNAALFLASDKASWISGEILSIDGGLTTH